MTTSELFYDGKAWDRYKIFIMRYGLRIVRGEGEWLWCRRKRCVTDFVGLAIALRTANRSLSEGASGVDWLRIFKEAANAIGYRIPS